jgi:hypothetical protein
MQELTTYLEDYLASIDNLPSELQQKLSEIKEKDIELNDVRQQLIQEETAHKKIYKIKRRLNNMAEMEKQANEKVQNTFNKAKSIADDKIFLAERLKDVINLHIKRLEHDLSRIIANTNQNQKKKDTITKLEQTHTQSPVPKKRKAATNTRNPVKRNKLLSRKNLITDSKSTKDTTNITNTIETPNSVTTAAIGTHDNDEQLYCFCQQVSYGEMIACDGENCKNEWFHYECVGLNEPPKGVWYCPDCMEEQKRKKEKEKEKENEKISENKEIKEEIKKEIKEEKESKTKDKDTKVKEPKLKEIKKEKKHK